MTTDRRRCSAIYPSTNTMPNTRIVHCHLEAGHPGEHEEEGTEATWLNDAEPVTPTPAEPRATGGIVSSFTTWSPLDIPAPFELPKPMPPEAVEEWMARFKELMGQPQQMSVLPDPFTLISQNDIAAAYERGIAEGLRQATEGWEREYAVRYPDGYVYDDVTEAAAREIVVHWPHRVVVSRLVGPWEPAAEQPEPDQSAPARIHVRHDPAALMEEPDLYADEQPEGSACPRDTNGDGDCGRPLCPNCGRNRG